jgi:hypothetical protein
MDETAPALPDYLEQDHSSVPTVLSNEGVKRFHFSTCLVGDDYNLIQAKEESIGTNHSMGKSFVMMSPNDMRHFIQPTDGQPLCFVAPCIGNFPTHIQNVLFFFHRLDLFIKTHALNHYVVPTHNIKLDKPRDHSKDVRGLRQMFRQLDSTAKAGQDEEGCAFDLSSSYLDGVPSSAEKEIFVDLPLLKIHVGFTGAIFNHEDDTKQEVFCVVTVRPARTFDIAAFIYEVFLSPRKGSSATEANADVCFLRETWTRILQYEANINCGQKDDPIHQQCSPYAPLGMFALLNLLNVPLRIHYVVRQRKPGCTGMRIIGFPSLSFMNDEEMRNYHEYVKEYVLHGEQNLHELRLAIQTYYSTKDGQQSVLEYDIKCPGGWPSRMSRSSTDGSDEVFKGWSIWRLPLCMEFALLVPSVEYETFTANVGALPALVVKKIEDMKQANLADPENCGACIADELVLKEARPMLPFDRFKQ